ncbi:DUF4190 domain-containing protein [Demequina aestuarii]|uniref:DUF4190 domain-containing protein n=1 Tax=Demequina aestuarii TaxID=327095 RepID=UPI000784D0E9|nr:DUF4190 domain-containing protein [Demequina aestuarii]
MTDVPPPPPPSAPQPFPGAGGNESKNSLGTISLVLGILGLVCCGFFTAIPAIIVGNKSKQAQAEGLATNGNLGQIGFILGIIGTVLSVLGAVIWGILIATGSYEFTTTEF